MTVWYEKQILGAGKQTRWASSSTLTIRTTLVSPFTGAAAELNQMGYAVGIQQLPALSPTLSGTVLDDATVLGTENVKGGLGRFQKAQQTHQKPSEINEDLTESTQVIFKMSFAAKCFLWCRFFDTLEFSLIV